MIKIKSEEIIQHIEHYAETKNIPDELVPFYDQCGRWRDESIALVKDGRHSSFSMIRNSILPESRRTAHDRHGTILLTSYVSYGKSAVSITFREIMGNVIIGKNPFIHAPNLRQVGGSISANECKRLYLPQLTSVGGSLNAVNGFSLKAPRLINVGGDLIVVGQVPPRIETVGGRFGIYWLFDVDLPRLRSVGGVFVTPKAQVIMAPVLETVGGSFLLSGMARRVHTPALTSVGGDFLAHTVSNLRAPRLRTVGGDFETQSAIDFYHPDIQVAGEWTSHPDAIENWKRRDLVRRVLRGHTGPLLL